MKITRRKEYSLNACIDGSFLWATPALFYISNKIVYGVVYGFWWVWCIVILVLFVFWFNMNFKIVKGNTPFGL